MADDAIVRLQLGLITALSTTIVVNTCLIMDELAPYCNPNR